MPPIDPSRLGSPGALEWHEAGHAVVAHLMGADVREVTIESDDDAYSGRVSAAWHGMSTRDAAAASGCAALAGPLAELSFEGQIDPEDHEIRAAWNGDWAEVERCAEAVEPDPELRTDLIRAWISRVEALIVEPRTDELIARVADALSAHGTLDETLFLDAI